jgi:GAF domain-containing protein
VPLTLPAVAADTEQSGTLLVAVLALGPRRSGLGYSSEDETLLKGLADQAGTAIYVARLVQARGVQ